MSTASQTLPAATDAGYRQNRKPSSTPNHNPTTPRTPQQRAIHKTKKQHSTVAQKPQGEHGGACPSPQRNDRPNPPPKRHRSLHSEGRIRESEWRFFPQTPKPSALRGTTRRGNPSAFIGGMSFPSALPLACRSLAWVSALQKRGVDCHGALRLACARKGGGAARAPVGVEVGGPGGAAPTEIAETA
jgi:hypothetical protein